MNRKAHRFWIVNVLSFILLGLLAITGLTNWLVLPKGGGAKGGFLASLRHFLIDVHEWAALLFLIVIIVHISFHWGYVMAMLREHGIVRKR